MSLRPRDRQWKRSHETILRCPCGRLAVLSREGGDVGTRFLLAHSGMTQRQPGDLVAPGLRRASRSAVMCKLVRSRYRVLAVGNNCSKFNVPVGVEAQGFCVIRSFARRPLYLLCGSIAGSSTE